MFPGHPVRLKSVVATHAGHTNGELVGIVRGRFDGHKPHQNQQQQHRGRRTEKSTVGMGVRRHRCGVCYWWRSWSRARPLSSCRWRVVVVVVVRRCAPHGLAVTRGCDSAAAVTHQTFISTTYVFVRQQPYTHPFEA